MKRINIVVSNEAYAALERLESDLSLKHKGQAVSLCIDTAVSALADGMVARESVLDAAAKLRGDGSPVAAE